MLDNVDLISMERLRNIDPKRLVLINKKLYNSHGIANQFQSSRNSNDNPVVPHTRRPYTKTERNAVSRQARLTGHSRPTIYNRKTLNIIPMDPERYKERQEQLIELYRQMYRQFARLANNPSKNTLSKRNTLHILYKVMGTAIHPIEGLMRQEIVAVKDTIELLQYTEESATPGSVELAKKEIDQYIGRMDSWSQAMTKAIEDTLDQRLMKFALRKGWNPSSWDASGVWDEIVMHHVTMYHGRGRIDRNATEMMRLMVRGGMHPVRTKHRYLWTVSGSMSPVSYLITCYFFGWEDSVTANLEVQKRNNESFPDMVARITTSTSFRDAMTAIKGGMGRTATKAQLSTLARELQESTGILVNTNKRNTKIQTMYFILDLPPMKSNANTMTAFVRHMDRVVTRFLDGYMIKRSVAQTKHPI